MERPAWLGADHGEMLSLVGRVCPQRAGGMSNRPRRAEDRRALPTQFTPRNTVKNRSFEPFVPLCGDPEFRF